MLGIQLSNKRTRLILLIVSIVLLTIGLIVF